MWRPRILPRAQAPPFIIAAFLCADLDVTLEPRDDHAAYLASWFKVLKNDKRATFTAAAHAQRAAGYLHELQGNTATASAAAWVKEIRGDRPSDRRGTLICER